MKVWCETDECGVIIGIYPNKKMAVVYGRRLVYTERAAAVTAIRRHIWTRAFYRCEHCGNPVTWVTMNMHERIWRGRGGDISIFNGVCLCAKCHLDDPVAGHGLRKVRFGEASE